MHENNIDHVDICKIDTEGSDKLVIKGLEYLRVNLLSILFLI